MGQASKNQFRPGQTSYPHPEHNWSIVEYNLFDGQLEEEKVIPLFEEDAPAVPHGCAQGSWVADSY